MRCALVLAAGLWCAEAGAMTVLYDTIGDEPLPGGSQLLATGRLTSYRFVAPPLMSHTLEVIELGLSFGGSEPDWAATVHLERGDGDGGRPGTRVASWTLRDYQDHPPGGANLMVTIPTGEPIVLVPGKSFWLTIEVHTEDDLAWSFGRRSGWRRVLDGGGGGGESFGPAGAQGAFRLLGTPIPGTEVSAVVPEPGTLAMALPALAAGWLAARQRRRIRQ